MVFKAYDVVQLVLEVNGVSFGKETARVENACRLLDILAEEFEANGYDAALLDDGRVVVVTETSSPPAFTESGALGEALELCDGFQIAQDGGGNTLKFAFVFSGAEG